MEGEMARGIHIVSRGHVKLSANSCEGRSLILQITEPGDILGLHNCITGAAYEMTAQSLQPLRVSFVNRKNLLRVLHEDRDACLSAAEQLGRTCHLIYNEVSSLKLSRSTKVRLARFLLSFFQEAGGYEKDCRYAARVVLDLTHDEVAQAIGTSRETVTRTLAEFRRKHLASLRRSTLVVQNRQELEKIAGLGFIRRNLAALLTDPDRRGAISFGGIRSFAAHNPALLKNGTRP
jgi:CRP/FNR family transcriptional regulator